MKTNPTVLLALFLIASHANAARDESLIRQTRKNQLAHDAAPSQPAASATTGSAPPAAPGAGHASANDKAPETGALKG